MIRKKQKIVSDDGNAIGGTSLLALSLFIILLAFFIILNSISNYTENKVNAVFDSLDVAFSVDIRPSELQKKTQDASQKQEKGGGDNIEDMQGILRSILPGLDVSMTENPNGGKVMAVRIKKDQFDRLASRLMPLLVRIMNVKDASGDYRLSVTAYVRDTLAARSRTSFSVIEGYRDNLVREGIEPSRMTLAIEKGNPAFMLLRFDNNAEGI